MVEIKHDLATVLDEISEITPDKYYVGTHPSSGRYACYCEEGKHGVAVTSNEIGMMRFLELIDLSGMSIKQVTFDEAMEILNSRPDSFVEVLFLVDSLRNVQVIGQR